MSNSQQGSHPRQIDVQCFWMSVAICQIRANTISNFHALYNFRGHQTDIFRSVFAERFAKDELRNAIFLGKR